MGEMVNKRITTMAAGLVAAIIVILNIYLIYKTTVTG
jgi:Mn2+/Fe2+ NRAMP family transporter